MRNQWDTIAEIPTKTSEGVDFDLKNYRGKLVLVDFWSIACRSCIEKMPEIKKVYEKYKENGFEVVSVCFIWGKNNTEDTERKRITSVHKEVGSNWPLLILGTASGDLGKSIQEKYGSSVPKLLLLNEKGDLIHYQGDLLKKGGLEKLVKQHFENQSDKI